MARRRKRSRWSVQPSFVFAAAVGGLLLYGVLRAVTLPPAQAVLVRAGLGARLLPGLVAVLDVQLAERFVDMGLVPSDVRLTDLKAASRAAVREYRFRAPAHLTPTQCNLWVARAAQAAGGEVLLATELHGPGAIVLDLGFGKKRTHRIVISEALTPTASAKHPHTGRIALVIDDLGYAMNEVTQAIFDLGIPLTVAVLPDLPASRDAFHAAQEAGVPALLHLPMQPSGEQDAGPGAITLDMSAAEIEAIIERHKRKYETFVGVNNHMGSAATADRRTMAAVAGALAHQGLFFFDSLTTPNSVAHAVARENGVWSIRNDLFLDDKATTAAQVANQLWELADRARERGLAVGIAHPRAHTLQALVAMLPRLRAEGIVFVTLDELRHAAQESSAARDT